MRRPVEESTGLDFALLAAAQNPGGEIVDNNTRIVPGSKALHHLLPELIVPIDRAYTQTFFRWQNPRFQYEQASCFQQAFAAFAEIARRVHPVQYVSDGWNSSRTKVIDNALVGMVLDETADQAIGRRSPRQLFLSASRQMA